MQVATNTDTYITPQYAIAIAIWSYNLKIISTGAYSYMANYIMS